MRFIYQGYIFSVIILQIYTIEYETQYKHSR